jgi:hypothetical protein
VITATADDLIGEEQGLPSRFSPRNSGSHSFIAMDGQTGGVPTTSVSMVAGEGSDLPTGELQVGRIGDGEASAESHDRRSA